MIEAKKNVHEWYPSENDYELVFMDVDGLWREVGHNLPQFSNILLSDYLNLIEIQVPDYTQFLRVIDYERNLLFEYRAYGGRIRIDVEWNKL